MTATLPIRIQTFNGIAACSSTTGISYINISGTSYHLYSVLAGYTVSYRHRFHPNTSGPKRLVNLLSCAWDISEPDLRHNLQMPRQIAPILCRNKVHTGNALFSFIICLP